MHDVILAYGDYLFLLLLTRQTTIESSIVLSIYLLLGHDKNNIHKVRREDPKQFR